jgi:hypothetical protein
LFWAVGVWATCICWLGASVELEDYFRSFTPFEFVRMDRWTLPIKDVCVFGAKVINVEVETATSVAIFIRGVKEERTLSINVFRGQMEADFISSSVRSGGVVLAGGFIFRGEKDGDVGRWSSWKCNCGSACC